MSYVLAFVGFAALIILHEAGHFLAAKAVGMRVERFSLFFGPMWLKRRRGETEYGVGVIPLGGYVKITGMSPREEFETPEIEARAYINQPVWKRLVVIGAGPAMNLLVAFILAWFFFIGQQHETTTNTVAAVLKHSAAANVLKPNDQLVSVDGVKGSAEQLHSQIETHSCAGERLVNGCAATTAARVVVRRDGKLLTFMMKPTYSKADGSMLLGFEFYGKYVPTSVGYAAGQSVTGLWRVTKATVSDIVQIFKAKDRSQLHGIIGGYKVTQEEIAKSASTGLEILALISLSLGIVNLFPFLPLDGGHIFWAVAEKLRGRKIPITVIERASLVGIGLIGILFIIGLSNDISSLAGKGFGVH